GSASGKVSLEGWLRSGGLPRSSRRLVRVPRSGWSGAVAKASVASVERRYDNGGVWAAVVVMLGWHVASALPTLLSGWPYYGRPAISATFWGVYALIGVLL